LPTPGNWTNVNWLKSRFHFSFAEFHDSSNQNFGVLRVMNDDLVQPARGFGTHGHRDAEICTYVVEGELTHQDSMGTSETLSRGSIQFMSAGRGVSHSEHNRNAEKPLRFIQMWLTPAEYGLEPQYGSACSSEEERRNRWCHIVSDSRKPGINTPVKIFQDVNMFVAELDAGSEVSLNIMANRQAYVLCIEGENLVVGGEVELSRYDALKVVNTAEGGDVDLVFKASSAVSGAHVLVVEMARSD
jgi:redox-sensitive bicupin YhaK (pirin superfamily)